MKHCRDCRYLDMEQKSIIGCVCTNTNRKRPATKNLGYIKYPSTPACKTGFEPREGTEFKNNIHDKVFTCPKCHNKALVPVEEPGVIGIGYHDLCICEECAAELLAEPQFDFTVKFVEQEDE